MSLITMIPYQNSGNIYTELLYRALSGVDLHYQQIPYSPVYVLRHGPKEKFHYLHFHWPEIFFVIRPNEPHKLFGFKGFLKLKAFWLLAKLRGYKIIWTVHEVDVHDLERHTNLHAWSRKVLWKLADLVFSHTPDVLAEAKRRWGNKRHAFTIPIGSYEGAYRADMSRGQARQRLGIPDGAFAFVFFGNVRPYKGIHLLLRAFRAVQEDHPQAHLIIAGKPMSEQYAQQVRADASNIPNTHLALGYVEDDDIQIYLRSADCFVAPYKYIETCSAIYLALAFELPIIIKSEGNVVDFAKQPIGVFMRDSEETESAMRRLLQLPAAEQLELRHNARQASQLFSWERLSQEYRKAFDAFETQGGKEVP